MTTLTTIDEPNVSGDQRRSPALFNVTPRLPSNGLTVAELFAGGGLMAVGLRSAGYNIVWANDFDKSAVKAYKANISDHIVHGDITQIDAKDIPDVDVIAGGPPCQDYSIAGTGDGEDGERGKLVYAYLDVIETKRPKAFVFENVKGLVGRKHRPTFDTLIERFESLGYDVYWRVINAWDYGVAQKRERVFIVGIRSDLGVKFAFPEPTTDGYRTQVLRDVIGDLPDPGMPLSDAAIAYLDRDPRHLAKHRPPTYDEAVPTLPAVLHKGVPYGLFYPPNHVGGVPTKEFGKREIGVGRHPLSRDDQPAYAIVASATGGKNAYANHRCFDNVGCNPTWEHANREADLDAPAPMRTEKDRCDGINTINGRPRRFTVRECLRIQSVPDWYVLPDGISLSAQYRIVGNGVASRVAYLLGIALADALTGGDAVV